MRFPSAKTRVSSSSCPGNARKRYKALLQRQDEFIKLLKTPLTTNIPTAPTKKLGIVACGIGYNYLMENYPEGCEYPVLKIGQYPLPKKQLMQLVEACDEILVLEDGQPFVEKQLKGYLGHRHQSEKGRLDGTLSQDGELNPDSVARAVGKENKAEFSVPSLVEMRPPALCEGCGHRDMYTVLTQVLKEEYPTYKVFSDIGCYTLGANAPFNAINSCVDMGASITMAKGASDAGLHPAVAVIGDSTFTHSGMTGLLDCVNENADVTIVISDNETTAMTGGQDSAGTGRLEAICAGIGVAPEHIRVVVPLKKNYEEMKQIIREEIEHHGVSVIIPRRECIQTLARPKKKQVKPCKKRHHTFRRRRTRYPLHRHRNRQSSPQGRTLHEAGRSTRHEPARRRRAVQPAHQRPTHRFGPHSHRKMRPHHLPGTDGSTALPPLPQPRRLAGDQ